MKSKKKTDERIHLLFNIINNIDIDYNKVKLMTMQFFTFSIDGVVLNELLNIVVFLCAFVSFWLFVALATCFVINIIVD